MKNALQFVYSLNKKICYIAMVAMFLLMCMTTVDTFLRKTALGGITDSFDITEIFLVLIIFCGFAHLESEKGHVRVDIFVNEFPKTLKRIAEAIMYLFSAGILFMIAYAMFKYIVVRYNSGAGTQVLLIPHWPFVVVITIALVFYAITTLLHSIEIAVKKSGDEKAK